MEHGLGVVLDHDHRVAQIAQAKERVQQAPVVPLVEPDGRLVQDVEDADQARADLRGQADALALPAGERGRRPVQGQVVQADVNEEAEAFPDLFQDAVRDELLAFGELQLLEESGGLPDRQPRDRRNGLPIDQDRQAFGLQPVALADGAERQRSVVLVLVFIVLLEPRAALGRLVAESVAARAGAVRAVEGEEAGRQFRIAEAAPHAGQLLAVQKIFLSIEVDPHQAMRLLERDLQRIRQPPHRRLVVLEDDTVHDDLDRVLLLLVQRDLVREVVRLAVDPRADESAAARILKFLAVLALAVPDNRRQDRELRTQRQRHQRVHHLLNGLGRDRIAALGAVRAADAGKEQPEVVVDLGDGAHGGAGIARGGLLLDGDGRRQPFDGVHVRLVHLLKKLAGVGREGLDVAALALGVDRVEGERRFAGAGQPGDHDELVAGDRQVEVLEIVLPRALDDDGTRFRHTASF